MYVISDVKRKLILHKTSPKAILELRLRPLFLDLELEGGWCKRVRRLAGGRAQTRRVGVRAMLAQQLDNWVLAEIEKEKEKKRQAKQWRE